MEHKIPQNKHYPRGWKGDGWKMSRRMFFLMCTETLYPILLWMIARSSMFKSYRGFQTWQACPQQKASTACFSSSPQLFQNCCNLRLTLITKGRFRVSSFFNSGRLTQAGPLASNSWCNKLKLDTRYSPRQGKGSSADPVSAWSYHLTSK